MQNIIALALIFLFCGCAKIPSLTNQKSLEAQRLNVLDQPIIYPTDKPAEVASALELFNPANKRAGINIWCHSMLMLWKEHPQSNLRQMVACIHVLFQKERHG